MFKKLLSALTVMLCVFGMNAGAQSFQATQMNYGKMMPKFANIMTSKVDLSKGEYWTGYWDGMVNENTQMVGVQQTPMNYDVAVYFPAGSLMTKDKTIEGIKFTFADDAHIDNVTVWMSSTLPATPNQADILCQDVEDLTSLAQSEDDFMNEIRFKTPYVADPNKGVYVGYSFNVNGGNGNADKFPIVFQSGVEQVDNSLFLNFASQGWDDYSHADFGPAAIQVLMKGEFKNNHVSVSAAAPEVIAPKDADFDLPITVANTGNGFKTLEGTVEINGEKTPFTETLSKEFSQINGNYTFNAKIHTPANSGAYEYKVTIEKVNGEANASADNVTKGALTVLSRLVQHKVFMEEFTGMWCGWCPRGFVALEKIAQVYGDKVTRVAAHSQDALECKEYSKIIQTTVAGFPNAHLDRTAMGIDPWYGKSQLEFGIKDDIDKCMAIAPVAEIIAQPTVDGDILKAGADVKFLYTGDASKYAIGFVVTEDGMENNKWSQTNNYAQFKGQGIEEAEPLFEPWVNGKSQRKGVIFNEVVIAAKGMENGISGSVPASVTEDASNVFVQEFDLSKYKKIMDREKLNLAVVLFDTTTGQVVNSDIKPLNSASGIDGVVADGEDAEEVARYTIDGRRIYVPTQGVNLVKYSDGTVKKVLVK